MAKRHVVFWLVLVGGCSDPYARWWQKDAPEAPAESDGKVAPAADAPIADAIVDGNGLAYTFQLSADRGIDTIGSGGTAVAAWRDTIDGAGLVATTAHGSPTLATLNAHTVIRFAGDAYLTVPVQLTGDGALFVVYANADHAAADRRLLGWDDSHAGLHGIGLAPDYHGGNELVVIARNAGTSLDHVLSPGAAGLEIDVIAWDAQGVTVIRRTQEGTTVTVPPQIAMAPDDGGYALHLGAAGDAETTDVLPFVGDIGAVRYVTGDLDPAVRTAIVEELANDWF